MLMFNKSKTARENNIFEVQSLELGKINLPARTASLSAKATIASYGQLNKH